MTPLIELPKRGQTLHLPATNHSSRDKLYAALTSAVIHRLRARLHDGVQNGDGLGARFLADHRSAIENGGRLAVRRAIASIEIAFANERVTQRLFAELPAATHETFSAQAMALRKVVIDAGLDDAPSAVPQALGMLRHSLAPASADAVVSGPHRVVAKSALGVEESRLLEPCAEECKQNGNNLAAELLMLRTQFGEFLLVSLADFYLCRALKANPNVGSDFVFVHVESASELWPFPLDVLATALEDRAEAIELILDRDLDSAAPARATALADDEILERMFDKGFECYQAADYEGAITHFSAALKIDSASFALYAYRGDAHRLLCNYERAIADYTSSLRLHPDSAPVLVQRATAHRQLGNLARSLEDADAAVKLDPSYASAYLCRADIHAANAKLDAAITDYARSIQLQADSVWSYFGRAKALQLKGQHESAGADFTRVLELNPGFALALLHRGQVRSAQGDLHQALVDYTEFLRHHPRNQVAYRQRAELHERKGDLERAIADCDAALALNAQDAECLCLRGRLHRRQGDMKSALHDLNEAIRCNPDLAPAYCLRGLIRLGHTRFTQAFADFNDALVHDPRLIAAYLGRALAHDRLGQHLDGIQSCGRALQIEPRCAAAFLLRGILSLHSGRQDRAIPDLTRAIELDPDFALSYEERGIAFYLSGDHPRAIADFSRFIELNPDQALAYVLRGTIRQLRGENEAALEDFGAALSLDPNAILAGWHQTLAERARDQVTRLLADYVDGIRPKRKAPAKPKRRTIVRPQAQPQPKPVAESPDDTPARAMEDRPTRRPPVKKTPASQETLPMLPVLANETQTALPAAPTVTQIAIPIENEAKKSVAPDIVPATDANDDILELKPAPAEAPEPEAIEPPAADVEVVEDVSEDQAAALLEEAPSEKVAEAPAAPEPALAIGADNSPLPCPMCREDARPYEQLPDRRVRCGKCGALFFPVAKGPTPAGGPRPLTLAGASRNANKPKTAKATKSETDDDDDDQMSGKKKLILSASAASILVVIAYFFFPSFGSSGDGPPLAAKVSADELLKEFVVNRTNASKKYTIGQIVVTGEVAEVFTDKRPRVRFKATDRSPGVVEALFSHAKDMKDIRKDSKISVRGECEGWQNQIVEISLCKVVATEAGEKK